MRIRHLALLFLLIAASRLGGGEAAGGAPGLSEFDRRAYPAAPLRGYGVLAGELVRWRDGGGRTASLLTITAADPAKADLVHAKLAADLRRLAPVEEVVPAVDGRPIAACRLGPATLVAVRHHGVHAWVATAPDATLLAAVLAPVPSTAATAPTVAMPGWLDGWDAHGFRFYMWAWMGPHATDSRDYHFLGEFDFARAADRGLVYWAGSSAVDGAVGLGNDVWWGAMARAALRRGVPVFINTMLENQTWLADARRDQTQRGMPQFCGGYHGVADPIWMGDRMMSWAAPEADRERIAACAATVRAWSGEPDVLGWLEPHGELRHGTFDVFLEHGAVPDRSYRDFLRARHHDDLAALARRWQLPLRAWDEVRVPEIAEFAGFDARAIDCAGAWRIAHEPFAPGVAPGGDLIGGGTPLPATTGPDPAWLTGEGIDAAWPEIRTPGDDLAAFLPKRPAVLRRQVDVPAGWLPAGGRAWLYVWDLNEGPPGTEVVAALNGTVIARDPLRHATAHWMAAEATGALKTGANRIALRLPRGFLGYRVYLSRHPPVQYPDLGEAANARWVDFTDWRRSIRVDCVRRGLEAIRRLDPERPIECMAPGGFSDGISRLCQDYGAHFHDTGLMGAMWYDHLPLLMRGARRPATVEPGGPAGDAAGFTRMMGLYLTEGVAAVHYFIQIGDVLWNDAIRARYEAMRPLLDTIGKVHPPRAEVAMLSGERCRSYAEYPWSPDPSSLMDPVEYEWRPNEALMGRFDFDALTELDLERGLQDRYRVLIDADTAIMDAPTVERLRAWVEAGGTFVALGQTGRHTPERRDAWPIAPLSGWRVASITAYRADGVPTGFEPLRRVEGETVLGEGAPLVQAHGLHLEAAAPECVPLARWADGSVAIGMRPVGRGRVIVLGATFPGHGRGTDVTTHALLERILASAGVAPLPARVTAGGDHVVMRRFRSNNGFHDLYVLWNSDGGNATKVDLAFARAPGSLTDVGDGRAVATEPAGDGAIVRGLALAGDETRILRAPCADPTLAAADWFELQRDWWSGCVRPRPDEPAPAITSVEPVVDLTADWRVQALADAVDAAALAVPAFDDAAWPVRALGPWVAGEDLPGARVCWRRRFHVPPTGGARTLIVRSWFDSTVRGRRARWWLDGAEVTSGDGLEGLRVEGLAAGSDHVVAIDVVGQGEVVGVRGNAWLESEPQPDARVDAAGAWQARAEALSAPVACTVPGRTPPARLVERVVAVPSDWAGRRIRVRVDCPQVLGVVINGRYVARHHHRLGPITLLDITPWVRPGEENRLTLVAGGSWEDDVRAVELWRMPER